MNTWSNKSQIKLSVKFENHVCACRRFQERLPLAKTERERAHNCWHAFSNDFPRSKKAESLRLRSISYLTLFYNSACIRTSFHCLYLPLCFQSALKTVACLRSLRDVTKIDKRNDEWMRDAEGRRHSLSVWLTNKEKGDESKLSCGCKWKNRFADNHRSTFIWLTKNADVQFSEKSWRLPLKAQRRDLAVLIASAKSTRASATNCSFSITNTGAVFDFPVLRVCAREWKTVLVFRWRLPTGASWEIFVVKSGRFWVAKWTIICAKIFSFGYFFSSFIIWINNYFKVRCPRSRKVRESLA